MNKKLWICLALAVIAAIALLTACAPEQQETPKVDYSAPTLSVAEDGISVSHEKATTFEYKADGGEWTAVNGKIAIDKTVGAHTVTARVKADDVKTAAEGQISYTVAAVSLELTTKDCTVSWTGAGKISVKTQDGEYKAATGSSLTVEETTTVYVKAEATFDQATKTFYVGETIEKQASITVVVPQLSAPQITVNANKDGLTIVANEHATKTQIKVDGGQYVDGTTHAFIAEAGQHTVTVKSLGDGKKYTDSVEVTFTYETKITSVTVTKTATETATWTYTGLTFGVKFGSETDYAPKTEASFTATESGVLSVGALGGYDEENKVFYAGNAEQSVTLVTKMATAVVLEDAEGKVKQDLADDWTAYKYENNGWTDNTKATFDVANGATEGKSMQLDCWANTTAFMYARNYTVAESANYVTIYAKGSGYLNFIVRLIDSNGVYVDYDLGILPAYWQRYTLSLDDTNWKVNFSGNKIGVEQAVKAMGMFDSSEIIPHCSRVAFIVKGNNNGSSDKMWIDDLAFGYKQDVTTTIEQPMFALATSYVASGSVPASLAMTSKTEAKLSATVGGQAMSQTFTFALSGNQIVLKDTVAAGAGLTITMNVTNNGAKLAVTSVEGQMASQYSALLSGMTFTEGTPSLLKIDFEDGTVGSPYVSDKWTAKKYTSDWVDVATLPMNCRTKDNSKAVNFAVGWQTTFNFYYTIDTALAEVNSLSVKLANDFSGAQEIKFKIILIDESGAKTFVAGDSDNWQIIEAGKTMTKYEFSLAKSAKNVKQICITVRSNMQDNAYLYADDIILY